MKKNLILKSFKIVTLILLTCLFSRYVLAGNKKISRVRVATFIATPVITSFSPASGAVGTLVTITGSNLSNSTAFSIGNIAAIVISNTGTQLVGMVMPGAVSGPVSVTTTGGAAFGLFNFAVIPTSYPSIQQSSKMVGTGNSGSSTQGTVAISADGNTAIVGGQNDNPTNNGHGTAQGAVWVYTRSGGAWSQQGTKLVGTGNSGAAGQGTSVALSADGNTALVGGFTDAAFRGAAWVFTRSGGVWTQQGTKLVGTGVTGANPGQGRSVALSADGNTAVIGGEADGNPIGSAYPGAVWVFKRTGSTWAQQGPKLVGTGNVGGAEQGNAVALSADGNTLAVGGFLDNSNAGAVWIYTRNGGVWTQQGAKLVGTGSIGKANQGSSVALSADGNTVLIGGESDNTHVGAAWVFTRQGGVWTQSSAKLVGSGNIGQADQGISVSLSADGNTAMIGGVIDNNHQGAAWVFTYSSGLWSQRGNKRSGTGSIGNAEQGTVSLSADGNTAILGGAGDNNSIGAAWIFKAGPSINANLAFLSSSEGSLYPSFSEATTSYTVMVSNATTSLQLTPVTSDLNATIKINGTAVTSGTASPGIPLTVAPTTIHIVVLAQDGTQRTYTVTVSHRSNNANLAGLTVSSGALSPTFAAGTTSYAITVSHATEFISITPTTSNANATVKINGTPVISGSASAGIYLQVGTNNIHTVVTAQDGTVKTYTVAVTRQSNGLSTNANLASLTISSGTLIPSFSTPITSYRDTVSIATTSITVTPTTSDATATVKVNGISVTSGAISASIPLSIGTNNVHVVVTAQDGTQRTYTILFSRVSPPSISYSSPHTYLTSVPINTLKPTSSQGATAAYSGSPAVIGSGFSNPFGVAADAAGNIYVADRTNNAIKKIPAGGGPPVFVGSGFIHPTGVAVDIAGNIYVADQGNNQVKEIPAGGGAIIILGSGFFNPSSVAVDVAGNVYVADASNNQIKKIPAGNGAPVAIGSGFNAPLGVAVDGSGNVFVADANNNAVKEILKSNNTVITRGSGFHSPHGVAVDASGNVFVGDYLNNAVKEIPAGGGATITIGSGLNGPTGVAADGAGRIFVGDYSNNAVKEIKPVGGYYINTALPEGLNFSNSTGIISGTPTVVSPAKNFTVTAYNAWASKPATVNIKITGNANLAYLTVSSGTLIPAFAIALTSYADTVSNATTSVHITPIANDVNAGIKVNGVSVGSGSASGSISLAVGNNAIYTVVTSADGTKRTYTVTVHRLSTGGLNSLYLPGNGEHTTLISSLNQKVEANNILTPNSDGINDIWVVKNIAFYPNNTVSVYDRSGKIVFTKKGYANDWAGTYRGSVLNTGTYYYSVDLGNGSVIKGFITVINNE